MWWRPRGRPESRGDMVDGAPVSVAVVTSRIEAELIVGLLQSYGLAAAVSADDAGGQEPQLQLQGVRVLVGRSDEAAARRILATELREHHREHHRATRRLTTPGQLDTAQQAAGSASPVAARRRSRTIPATSAMSAAPTRWDANTHPNTTGARAPKCSRTSAIVGGAGLLAGGRARGCGSPGRDLRHRRGSNNPTKSRPTWRRKSPHCASPGRTPPAARAERAEPAARGHDEITECRWGNP